MTSTTQSSQAQDPSVVTPSNKELNFRALESRYEKQLAQERESRIAAERALQERQSQVQDDDDSEPYVDHKKLEKKLAKFSEQSQKATQSEVQREVQKAIYEERKNNWVKNNADFYDVLGHADKLAQTDPELAETILEMPEGFERQKLVYKNIKALGLHKPPVAQASIQDKVDANRRSPYYQPSGISAAPYSTQGDFSKGGQKQAYEKMQALKNQLRI